jgi:hypothetical protein
LCGASGERKTGGDSVAVLEFPAGTAVADPTPEQEALSALSGNRPRSDLSPAAQLQYDRLKPAWEQDAARRTPEAELAARRKREAGLARRHKVDQSGTTHTFCFYWVLHRVCGIGMAAIGVCSLGAVAVPGPAVQRVAFIGIGVLFIFLGICIARAGVQITDRKMTIRNYVFTYTVDASEIRAITLRERSMGQSRYDWIPRIELTNGNAIWIATFDCGSSGMPPKSDLVATIDEVRALLGVVDDTGVPEVRVYELAREFGVKNKAVMDRLLEMGEFIRSAASLVSPKAARQLREEFTSGHGDQGRQQNPRPGESPQRDSPPDGKLPAQVRPA